MKYSMKSTGGMTKLAVIPARGGSIRLKGKNIYPLNGKPLICYTIEAVVESRCFDTIIVSTDNDKIAGVASEFKEITIYRREQKYATARITVLEALLAMMDHISKHDIFAYFLPTCPFRNSDDIKGGIELLTNDVDSVVGIVEYSEPIQLALIKKGNDVVPVFDNLTAGLTNSRYIQKYYRPNGTFYMSWWDSLVRTKNFFVGNVKGYEMTREKSHNIDDVFDIFVAERIIENGLL